VCLNNREPTLSTSLDKKTNRVRRNDSSNNQCSVERADPETIRSNIIVTPLSLMMCRKDVRVRTTLHKSGTVLNAKFAAQSSLTCSATIFDCSAAPFAQLTLLYRQLGGRSDGCSAFGGQRQIR
jgi:hypothetical protein